MVPGVSWMASLSLSLWVPGQGLTNATGHTLSQRVCPIHLQRLWRISSSAGCCLVRYQSSLLLMVSGHWIWRILLGQVLMNVWIFFSVAAMVIHVSALYSRTGFTVVLKILILMLMVMLRPKCFLFGGKLLSLCQFSLLHWHQSPLVCQQLYLGRWNLSRLLNPSPSSVMGVVLTAALFLRTLLLPMWTLRPKTGWILCKWIGFLLQSVTGYGRGKPEPDHLQSPGHQDGSKKSTEFHFSSVLWMSSTSSQRTVGIGRVTAGILVSLLCLLQRPQTTLHVTPL